MFLLQVLMASPKVPKKKKAKRASAKTNRTKAQAPSKRTPFDALPSVETDELLPPPPPEAATEISAPANDLPPPPVFTPGHEKWGVWEDMKKTMGLFKSRRTEAEREKRREQKKLEKERKRMENLQLKEFRQEKPESITLDSEKALEQKRKELESVELPPMEMPVKGRKQRQKKQKEIELPSFESSEDILKEKEGSLDAWGLPAFGPEDAGSGDLPKLESIEEKRPMEHPGHRMEIRRAIEKARTQKPAAVMEGDTVLAVMNQMAEDGREALLNMNLARARYIYIELMKIYRRLPDEERQKTYEMLKELYEERKSAEKLTRA